MMPDKINDTPESSVSRELFRFVDVDPDDFCEPADYEGYRPWEATPATWSVAGEHQQLVWAACSQLLESAAPPSINPLFNEMLQQEYYAAWAMRSMQNFDSFSEFSNHPHDFSIDLEKITEKVRYGRATSRESLILLKSVPDLESIELSKLYHPYGARGRHLPDMQRETTDSIIDLGGALAPASDPARSIHIHPRYMAVPGSDPRDNRYELAGFLVTYKKDIGRIEKNIDTVIKVVERSSVALTLDADLGFDAEILRAVQSVDHQKLINGTEKDWMQSLMVEATGLQDYVEELIQSQSSLDCIIPLSTAHFGYQEAKQPQPLLYNVGQLAVFNSRKR